MSETVHKDTPILSVQNMRISLAETGSRNTGTSVTENVSFNIMPGEILGIVGESGCGKSVTALALMGLLPDSLKVTEGSALFGADGSTDLFSLTPKQRQELNGSAISMIYQEPLSALNPLKKIGVQVGEVLRLHTKLGKQEIHERVIETLRAVDLHHPEKTALKYPHELSGGMRQRICIAMAAISEPRLLIADEPTTALDVCTQAEILDLIRRLNKDKGTSVLFISHDLKVVESICDRVMVMYAGAITECGPAEDILSLPAHPYTIGLIRSIPMPDMKGSPLECIPGKVPSVEDDKDPCPFAPRCFLSKPICRLRKPARRDFENGHYVYCHFANERQRSRWNNRKTTSSN